MLKPFRTFFRSKLFRACLFSAMISVLLCLSVFAEDGSGTTSQTVISAFTTGFASIVSDAKSMIASIVPIALPLAGVIFLVRKGISWFKMLSK